MESVYRLRILNRDTVKLLAILTMTANHIARLFIPAHHPLYEVMINTGYFTAVTMCFFLVEGFYQTHSQKKYGMRLLLFGLLSQPAFAEAFGTHRLNMLITLFLCFLILRCLTAIRHPLLCCLSVASLFAMTLLCDWPLFAPLFTVLFYRAGCSRQRIRNAYLLSWLLFTLNGLLSFLPEHISDVSQVTYAVFRGLAQGCGIAVSGLVILFLYRDTSSARRSIFFKWFFYLYYPLHLLLLAAAAYLIGSVCHAPC